MAVFVSPLLAITVSLWSLSFLRRLSSSPSQTEEVTGTESAWERGTFLSLADNATAECANRAVSDGLKASNHDTSENVMALQAMSEAIPDSTAEERIRFLAACRNGTDRAMECLSAYLAWRRRYAAALQAAQTQLCAMDEDDDARDWNIAATAALLAHDRPLVRLPRVVRTPPGAFCRRGCRILLLLPGVLNDRLADVEVYALAVALYCGRKLAPASLERLFLVADVQPGHGWSNAQLSAFLSFTKQSISLLLANFPERLDRALVYPVPHMLRWVWTTVSYVLDANTRQKFCLLSGDQARPSQACHGQILQFLGPEAVEMLEMESQRAFRNPM